jgi:hypothetical protein
MSARHARRLGALHWLAPVAVVAIVLAPMALSDRTFATDWSNHLWLIASQSETISELGRPSIYLHSSLGALYPFYAFYGGTLYAFLGSVALVLGPEGGIVFGYAVACVAHYLGWTWLAHQAGARGWAAQLPGALSLTSAYSISVAYGRGGLAETMATFVIPLALAAAIAFVRSTAWRWSVALLYVATIILLSGSHTLSLVWGSTFLALAAGLLLLIHRDAVRPRLRRLLVLGGLTGLGLSVNAWILAPIALYHDRLQEGGPDGMGQTEFTSLEQLLSLVRDNDGMSQSLTADINVQLPVLALIWTFAVALAVWPAMARRRRLLAVGAAAVGGVFVWMLASPALIEALPSFWRYIQFPYRLATYAEYALLGVLVLVLAALPRRTRMWRVSVSVLAAIAAISVVEASVQISDVRSWLPGGRAVATASPPQAVPTWYAGVQFGDGSAPILETMPRRPLIAEIAERPEREYEASYPPGPAAVVATNVATGTYLAGVRGARPVGRTSAGRMVVELPASATERRVVFEPVAGPALTASRWLSVLALVLVLGLAVLAAATSVRARRAGRRAAVT